MIEIIKETYQMLFISSMVIVMYYLFNLIIKTYSRFKFEQNTKFILETNEKILLWCAITIIFSYIF